MNSSNPMTREELLESAVLDAYGLLDEYEEALFTRSFHHAAAAVQGEILELQAELVSDPTFMSPEKPDPSLRGRVLSAVNTAIEHETAELEPLATIGRPRITAADLEARLERSNAAFYWRAAAFLLCAGLIVVAYFYGRAVEQGNRIASLALSNNTKQLAEQLGATSKDFLFNPTARKIHFRDVAGGNFQAVLYINEATGQAFLVTDNLPLEQEPVYTLRVRNAKLTDDIHAFISNGVVSGTRLALSAGVLNAPDNAWEILGSSNQVLMVSI